MLGFLGFQNKVRRGFGCVRAWGLAALLAIGENAVMYTFTDESEDSARQRFASHGLSVDQWAKAHGFSSASVTAVLAGKNKGLRGQSHHIAVPLSLKPAPSQTSPPDPAY